MDDVNRDNWAKFFSDEEKFFKKVTSTTKEITSFGMNCYPRYREVLSDQGKMVVVKPQHVRWIGHVNDNQALFNELMEDAIDVYSLYDSLSASDKPCSRVPIFLKDAKRIAVHTNDAYSSNLITKRPEISLARKRYGRDIDKDYAAYNKMCKELHQLGFQSAHVEPSITTISLKVSSRELAEYFGREDVVFRRRTGNQYRSCVYWQGESNPMKLGFFISLSPITYHTVITPRESRRDSYLKSGKALSFPGPCDGDFWISKTPQ